jgi:hypothetical protein
MDGPHGRRPGALGGRPDTHSGHHVESHEDHDFMCDKTRANWYYCLHSYRLCRVG